MKKWIALLLAAVLCLGLAACSSSTAGQSSPEVHQIGVIVYNTGDEEVISFREYLQGYIQSNFEMVRFVYSDSISTQEQEMAFIQNACDAGVEGFMSFRTFDLKAEVELCEKNGAYYMLASGTVSDEEFDSVADNPWFLGMFGPGTDAEYKAGQDMARFFLKQKAGDSFFILSGGAGTGNEMHYLRTLGMLYELCASYGASFGQPLETLAASSAGVTVSDKGLTVTLCPGYLSNAATVETVSAMLTSASYDVVMSVIPPQDMVDLMNSRPLGIVDSYNTRNLQLFVSGQLDYLVGKYSSSIGPAFALMLNAVTGFAEEFRDNGRAVKIAQSFWTSDSLEDFTDKYALASSTTVTAYNFRDLAKVCRIYNGTATLAQLSALARSSSYADAMVRRAAD